MNKYLPYWQFKRFTGWTPLNCKEDRVESLRMVYGETTSKSMSQAQPSSYPIEPGWSRAPYISAEAPASSWGQGAGGTNLGGFPCYCKLDHIHWDCDILRYFFLKMSWLYEHFVWRSAMHRFCVDVPVILFPWHILQNINQVFVAPITSYYIYEGSTLVDLHLLHSNIYQPTMKFHEISSTAKFYGDSWCFLQLL